MACTFPIKMFRDTAGNVCSVKKYEIAGVAYKFTSSDRHTEFYVPCGQCLDCRITKARDWASRCMHEVSFWKTSSFITLTYAEVPENNSLDPRHTKQFIRDLRSSIGKNFKYFLVGEYGDTRERPHYHAIIFGHDFGYQRSISKFKNCEVNLLDLSRVDYGSVLQSDDYEVLENTSAIRSSELESLWSRGFASVGEVTFDSAIYCAQYAVKKLNGTHASWYGERLPEFMRQSQNAIGKEYAHKYLQEIIDQGSIISNGAKLPIPRYYLKQAEKLGIDLSGLKQSREDVPSSVSYYKSYARALALKSKFGRNYPILDDAKFDYVSRNGYYYEA